MPIQFHWSRWMVLLVILLGTSCDPKDPKPEEKTASKETASERSELLGEQIQAFCGACHALPKPSSFPKSAWHEEVSKGFNFYFESGRSDLKPPPMVEVVNWFAAQAPKELQFATPLSPPPSGPVPFRHEKVLFTQGQAKSNLAIASLAWAPLSSNEAHQLLLSDMRTGELRACSPLAENKTGTLLAKLDNPCRLTPTDLDADGAVDFVVSELGSFLPQDHSKGRVVWLRRSEGGTWEPTTLLESVGRVADIQPADLDGDGDVDLLVAEFGWRKTGHILILENLGIRDGKPELAKKIIDGRHGTIHVPIADVNGDGRPDFFAMISQEHESIELFINEGEFRFRKQAIFSGEDPAFGSTGIELVDFDQDGDIDVLATNGDMFDTFYVKPYHGIRWLENAGENVWNEHFVAPLPGVHRAVASDLDGDGDLDIVASSLIPETTAGKQVGGDTDAVIWIEQLPNRRFQAHSLLKGLARYASLQVADFDADGDIDIAIGAMREEGDTSTLGYFWNERVSN